VGVGTRCVGVWGGGGGAGGGGGGGGGGAAFHRHVPLRRQEGGKQQLFALAYIYGSHGECLHRRGGFWNCDSRKALGVFSVIPLQTAFFELARELVCVVLWCVLCVCVIVCAVCVLTCDVLYAASARGGYLVKSLNMEILELRTRAPSALGVSLVISLQTAFLELARELVCVVLWCVMCVCVPCVC